MRMPEEMCRQCKYALWDYVEYYGGARQWFLTDCGKGTEPHYDEDEEAWECEGGMDYDGRESD